MDTEKHINQDENLDDLLDKIAKGAKKKNVTKNKNDEINIEDVEFDKLDEKTKKVYSDLHTQVIDVYKIMGLNPDDPQELVRKRCNEKLAKYHPDKIGPILKKIPLEQRAKEKKRLDMQYKLVKEAYGILHDPQKRKFYDLQKKTIDSKNFVNQKKSFDDFIKLQDSEINENTKKNAADNFRLKFFDLDNKHGFNREKLTEKALDKKELEKKMSDLVMSRESQEIECTPEKLFEGDRFDPVSFNKAFMRRKKIEEKKKQKESDPNRALTLWGGVGAAFDEGLTGSSSYVPVTNNYDDLYASDNTAGLYSSKLDSNSEGEDDIVLSDDDYKDDYNSHNKNRNMEDIEALFKKMKAERELETEMFDKRQINDPSWKSVMENPMNISAQFGNVVGKDVKALPSTKKNKLNKAMVDAYASLLYDGKSSK